MKPYLLILFSCFTLFFQAQNQTTVLLGKVENENSLALPNTTVSSKTVSRLTFTDSLGRFSLLLPQTKLEVKFSYIGYESQTLTIKQTIDL